MTAPSFRDIGGLSVSLPDTVKRGVAVYVDGTLYSVMYGRDHEDEMRSLPTDLKAFIDRAAALEEAAREAEDFIDINGGPGSVALLARIRLSLLPRTDPVPEKREEVNRE